MRRICFLLLSIMVYHYASAQWTTNTSVNTEVSSTITGDCRALATSDGKTWLAYFKNVPAPNYFEMRAQLLDKDGVKLLGPEGVLVNNAAHPSFTTVFGMAVDNNNNLTVGFANSSLNIVYVNKIDQTGTQVWNASGITFANALLPRFCVMSNNDVIVTWFSTNGTRALMQKLSAATGAALWAAPITVEPVTASHRTTPGNIFPLSNGDFIHMFHNRAVAFGTSSTLWAQRYNTAGVAQWAAPIQLSDKTASYNREYFPMMHNDTLFIGYSLATGSRFDAFLQRINPDGTKPWGMTGIDFAIDPLYYEQDIKIAIVPSTNIVWAYTRLTNTSQGNQGTYVQKFNKQTGARQLGDNGKAVFALQPIPQVVPLAITLFSDNSPVLFLMRSNPLNIQFLYATKLDDNGNFAWPGDTIAIAKFSAAKGRMDLMNVVNNQAVAVWVERKGTFDQPYAQPVRFDGSTGVVAPVASFTEDKTTACANAPVQFNSTSTGYVATYAWSFPGGSPSSSNLPNLVVSYPAPGNYNVSLTVSNSGGSNTMNKTALITVPVVVANAGADKSIVIGDEIRLEGSATNAATIAWTPNTTLTSPGTLTPKAQPTTTTTYTLTVTNSDNCVATDDVTITVVPYCIKVMNAFTPNGDGINDRWLVTNGDPCTNQISVAVYNRYGNAVYRNDNYNNNWDGKYDGKPVADGTYYYTVTFKTITGKTVLLRGDVTILR